MGDKVTLLRPDGSEINVNVEDADQLRVLGYKDQTPEQLMESAVNKSTQEYYTTPGQQLKTGIEGALGGATLGLSDLAFSGAGFDTAERGQYNPGIRLGTELIGGLLPMAGGIGELTPAGLLSKGARAAGGLAEGTVAGHVITGAIEGGGFGAQAAISNSVINGDPLTTEAVMAGIGWGGVWGGGLGFGAGKLAARAEAKAAARLTLEGGEEASSAMLRSTEDAWDHFRGGIKDAATQAEKTTAAADEIFNTFNEKATVESATRAKSAMTNEFIAGQAEYAGFRTPEAKALHEAAGNAFKDIRQAAKDGNFDALKTATEAFKEHSTALSQLTGIKVPEIAGFAAEGAKASTKAAAELADMTAATEQLRNMPLTPEEFASMKAPTLNKMAAAVDTFMAGSHAELTGVREGLKAGIDKLESAIGMATDGSPSTKLRAAWEHLAKQKTVAADNALKRAVSGKAPWAAKKAAYEVAKKLGMPASIAYSMTHGLLGLKAAVVGGMTKAVTEWAPRALRTAGKFSSRMEPLKVRLDGTQDKAKQTRSELMKSRATEIREAAGSVRDTLYKSVSVLAETHPELAASLHQLGIEQFKFLLDKLPRDPGLAFSRLKSLWEADPVQVEKFARYYDVFQNPVNAIQTALKTGHITPEAAEGLREMHPALFQQLRVDMLVKLSDPKVMNKLSYSEQVSLGTLLQIPLHSTMTPQFVATQQQMYMEKNQKIPMPPQPGAAGGGGRPPGPANSDATSSQKITEH